MSYELTTGETQTGLTDELVAKTPMLSYDTEYFEFRSDLTLAPVLTNGHIRSRVDGCALYMASPTGTVMRIAEALNSDTLSTDVSVMAVQQPENPSSPFSEEGPVAYSGTGYMLSFINDPDSEFHDTVRVTPLEMKNSIYDMTDFRLDSEQEEHIRAVLDMLEDSTPLKPGGEEVRLLEDQFKTWGGGAKDFAYYTPAIRVTSEPEQEEPPIQTSLRRRIGNMLTRVALSATKGLGPTYKQD